jgi:AcrR family transcriptional regulator
MLFSVGNGSVAGQLAPPPYALQSEAKAKPLPAVNEADPRVKRTRKLLQDALLELLAEKSFDAITVQDIAERSTVNRATFYAHFVDKYELFAAFSRDWFRKAVRRRLGAETVLSRPNLRLLILASMEALAEMDDHCRPTDSMKPLVMSAVQEELAAVLLGWLERAPAGATRPVPLETTAAGLSWAIFGTALDWSRMPERTSAEPTAGRIADLLTGGLSSVVDELAG